MAAGITANITASVSKPGPSNQAVNLDLPSPRPRPTSHSIEKMEVDYGPSLPPCLGADRPNALDYHSGLSEAFLEDLKSTLTLIKGMTLN